MGLRVNVYKSPLGDCTNGGISSKVSSLTVINVEGPFEPSDSAPAAVLVEGPGGWNPIIVPEELHKQKGLWTMFGGNYATGDSRLSQAARAMYNHHPAIRDPLAIHDRVEPWPR